MQKSPLELSTPLLLSLLSPPHPIFNLRKSALTGIMIVKVRVSECLQAQEGSFEPVEPTQRLAASGDLARTVLLNRRANKLPPKLLSFSACSSDASFRSW